MRDILQNNCFQVSVWILPQNCGGREEILFQCREMYSSKSFLLSPLAVLPGQWLPSLVLELFSQSICSKENVIAPSLKTGKNFKFLQNWWGEDRESFLIPLRPPMCHEMVLVTNTVNHCS